MHTTPILITCQECGSEFRSAFSGGAMVRGCVEQCPSCRTSVATPTSIGVYNFDLLERSISEPMTRLYGDNGADGYIFMGRGELQFSIRSPILISVLAAYERNIHRALDLIDVYYQVEIGKKQVLLSAIYISIMTAYECLTDDLFTKLLSHGLAKSISEKRPNLRIRRDNLFQIMRTPPPTECTTSLEYLYAFRNCLTHNAGIIDNDLISNLQRIDSNSTQFYLENIGCPLVLDVSSAISFADAAQHIAYSLFTMSQEICNAKGM